MRRFRGTIRAVILLMVLAIPAASAAEGMGRIAATSPGIAEIVFALDAGASVVAVPEETRYPLKAAILPKAGTKNAPDLEILNRIHPDVVFLLPASKGLIPEFEGEGIMAFTVEDRTLSDIRKSIVTIGKVLGRTKQAQALVSSIDKDLDALRVPSEQRIKRRVLVVLDRQPGKLNRLIAAGADSYYHEIIRLLGCENACAKIDGFEAVLSLEGIVQSNPDVILELRGGETLSGQQRSGIVGDWQQMKFLTAVMEEQVYVLVQDFVEIPGPRVVDLARLFSSLIRPAK